MTGCRPRPGSRASHCADCAADLGHKHVSQQRNREQANHCRKGNPSILVDPGFIKIYTRFHLLLQHEARLIHHPVSPQERNSNTHFRTDILGTYGWECHFLTIQRVDPDGIKSSKITFHIQLLAKTILHFWRAYFCSPPHLLSSAVSNEKWLLVTRVYTVPLSITSLWHRSDVLWPRPILSEALSVTEGLWPATGCCTL